ncbi:hypothetical protein H0W32_01905 [Patescibacteria group bacterium]|nr:hypothetical protein [Patescibacteria group bacterium]
MVFVFFSKKFNYQYDVLIPQSTTTITQLCVSVLFKIRFLQYAITNHYVLFLSSSIALNAWHKQNAVNSAWGRGYNPLSASPLLNSAIQPEGDSAAECLMPVRLTGGPSAQLG